MSNDTENGFIDLIKTQRGGALEAELDAELTKLTGMLRARGGTGKITLTFNLSQIKEYESAVGVLEEIKMVPPKLKRHAALRFYDGKGGLTVDQPEQGALFEKPQQSSHEPERPRPSATVPRIGN